LIVLFISACLGGPFGDCLKEIQAQPKFEYSNTLETEIENKVREKYLKDKYGESTDDSETEVDTDDEDSGVPQTSSELDYDSDSNSSTTSELLLPLESNDVFVNDNDRPVVRDERRPFKPAFAKLIEDTFNVSLQLSHTKHEIYVLITTYFFSKTETALQKMG